MARNITLHQLTQQFYKDNDHLIEMIDKDKNGNVTDKGRGYGVLLVKVHDYQFALPVRSKMHINHKDNFTTKIHDPYNNGRKVRHGLDYSKAVIIHKPEYINQKVFSLVDKSDYLKIVNSERRIVAAFTTYVTKYIEAVTENDRNKLRRFQYSTLRNYHRELGC